MIEFVAKFEGDRLRELRIARGRTATEVAERVGVSPASLTQYEKYDRQPRPSVVTALAAELRAPEAYFFRPSFAGADAARRFRSLASTTKGARASVEVRLKWLREVLRFVDQYVDLPEVDLPAVDVPENPLELDDEGIDVIAASTRAAWSLGGGPIADVIALLEAKGVCVARFAFGDAKVDGVSQLAPERPVVLLNSEAASSVRSRFDAAHELAHLILHRGAPANPAADVHARLEQQAHRFAAAFLLPAEAFVREVYSVSPEALLGPKKRWRVSMQMMIRRAFDLELITREQYSSAFRVMSARGYRRQEPLDADLNVEQPTLLARSLQLLFENRVITPSELSLHLPFDAADLRLLTNSELATESGPPDVVVDVRARGRVVPFRPR